MSGDWSCGATVAGGQTHNLPVCYSAQIWAEFNRYVRAYGARLDVEAYAHLFWSRLQDPRIKIPKAMEQGFGMPDGPQESNIFEAIRQYRTLQATALEQELFKQRRRLADAHRTLESKTTKAAAESARIANSKIQAAIAKLANLHRTEVIPQDQRIYPGYYAPVLVMEDGELLIKPMRYQCRPEGKPASYDTRYPGTYNARRDNLEGFWRGQFGHNHGLVMVHAFYEHVTQQDGDAKKNRILEFRPRPAQEMLVACLWSRWSGEGQQDLTSFAMITDEPPEEVAAAGHDRCIIPIQPHHMDAWLNPNPRDLFALYTILDDRMPSYFEHRLAAA